MNLPSSKATNAVLTGAAFCVLSAIGWYVVGQAQKPPERGNTFTIKFDGQWLEFTFADGRSAIVREKSISALEYWPTAKAKQLGLPPHINMVVGAHTQRIDLARDEDEEGRKLFDTLVGYVQPEGDDNGPPQSGNDNGQRGE